MFNIVGLNLTEKQSKLKVEFTKMLASLYTNLTHCGRVTQNCVFNTVKLGTSASSP